MNASTSDRTYSHVTHSPIPGLLLTYRLVEGGGFFYVDVTAADASGERHLRSGALETREMAEQFLALAARHSVTPYTLDAVFDEWQDSL